MITFEFHIIPITCSKEEAYYVIMPNSHLLYTQIGFKDEYEQDVRLYDSEDDSHAATYSDTVIGACFRYIHDHFKHRKINIVIHPQP